MMSADAVTNILGLLKKVKQAGDSQWYSLCPAHEDHNPSLSIGRGGDGRVLLKCHAGCATKDILKAIGLTEKDLFLDQVPKARRKITATYNYCDKDGTVLYQVVRFSDKSFMQRRPDANGGWIKSVKGVPKVLYRLPEIISADPDAWIFVVEGEKDANSLAEIGLIATTNSGGGCKWKILSDDSALYEHKIVVIPDKDKLGFEHFEDVCKRLSGKVKELRYLILPGDGKDVTDWLNAGGDKEGVLALVESAPKWYDKANEVLSDCVSDDEVPERSFVQLGEVDPETDRLVLSPRRTLPTAEAYMREFHTHPEGNTLVNYAGLLMEWKNNRYLEIEDNTVKKRLQPWLHESLRYVFDKKTGAEILVPFESNPTTINAALESIRTHVHLPASITLPSWLKNNVNLAPAKEILACKSMNLHIPSGKVYTSTPRLFTTNALEFDYDENAPEPINWLKFLDALWDCDAESIELLQDWFGYCLTADTSQQKMLLMVGPRRCGKGTIGRILKNLIGEKNVCGPTTGSLAGTFGLQPLIGKSLAIVSDARFTGQDIGIVVERLLCISGEDSLTIDRKHKESITMKLPTRFMFLTNELPRLTDASNALAGRFMLLRINKSWFGKEDHGLEERLMQELPGILLWSLQGWVRLREQGRFIQPSSSQDSIEELEDLCSPVAAFVKEKCIVGPGYRISIDMLYAAWQMWCEKEGRSIISTRQTFGRDLAAAVPSVRCRRYGERFYDGIALDILSEYRALPHSTAEF